MIKHEGTIVINASISEVFKFLDGSNDNLQKLDPKIIKNELINQTPEMIGTTYLQQYQEGKKIEEYIITVTDYLDTEDCKVFEMKFTLANNFDIKVYYKLTKLTDTSTELFYETTNSPLKWYFKVLLKVMPKSQGQKMITSHLEKIKSLVEES